MTDMVKVHVLNISWREGVVAPGVVYITMPSRFEGKLGAYIHGWLAGTYQAHPMGFTIGELEDVAP